MIEIKDLSIAFANRKILSQVNLKIREQESLVIIGPSGAGKSVLLKIIAGVLRADSGELKIAQKNIWQISEQERVNVYRQLGMLFQKNALFDSLSVGENIAFPMRETTLLSESEINKSVDYYLEAVGIAHAKNLFPDEISGGMQKRLGIARALALKPKILLYDDPTAGLDPITSRNIANLILDLKKQRGSTILSVTNDMNRAFQMADKIAMIVDSEIILMNSVEEAKKSSDARVQQFINGNLQGPLSVIQ